MSQINVGWAGSYRRQTKMFDVALHTCDRYGYKFKVAGFLNTMLYIPHEKMPDFYRSIDVLLVTSIMEAHPLVVYEALSCEVPVVMMRVGDCLVENLPGICYYDPEIPDNPEETVIQDPEVIAQSIENAYENREKLGREGRSEIVRRWQWKHWIPRYTKMFQEVTGKEDGMRVAIVIDKPGWAWDIMAKIIKRELLKTNSYEAVGIYYTKGLKKNNKFHVLNFPSKNYDVILNHHWQVYNHRQYRPALYEKTILCANGEAYREKTLRALFEQMVECVPAITSVSCIIVKDLKKRFDKPIYHCSRGVDVDMFCPTRLLERKELKYVE